MINRAIFTAIVLAPLLPVTSSAQAPEALPYCGDATFPGFTGFVRFAPSACPEDLALITLEGMLDLTLDPDMVDPQSGNDASVKQVLIDCAICTEASCTIDPQMGIWARETHTVIGQPTVQVAFKTWFGIQGADQGGLPVNPADISSYRCRVLVSGSTALMQGFVEPSPFISVEWGPDRFAKVLDTPAPVLELSGTIN